MCEQQLVGFLLPFCSDGFCPLSSSVEISCRYLLFLQADYFLTPQVVPGNTPGTKNNTHRPGTQRHHLMKQPRTCTGALRCSPCGPLWALPGAGDRDSPLGLCPGQKLVRNTGAWLATGNAPCQCGIHQHLQPLFLRRYQLKDNI